MQSLYCCWHELFNSAVSSRRSRAAAIVSVEIWVPDVVLARADTELISSDMFDPVWISVPPIVARPPTSAVDGRRLNPARRIVGLLFMLAAWTRALRPTVLTAASRLSRAVDAVTAPAERDTVPPVRTADVPRDDDAPASVATTREPTRTVPAASVAVRDAPDAVAPAVRAVTAPPDDDVVAAPVVADATFLAAAVVVVRLATMRPGVDVAPRDDTPVVSDDDTELGIARDAVAPHAHANGANTANK